MMKQHFRTRGLKSQDFFLVSPELEMPSRAGPRTFAGVAYSGEVVTDQWFWDAVAFDLDGMAVVPERMPVLRDHDPGRILGYTTGFSKAGGLEVRGTFLEGSADAREVAAMADEGCPWRLSVHIVPDRLETLERGDRSSVNGRGVAGPLTIFREPAVREAGFRSVGADRGTGAAVFFRRKTRATGGCGEREQRADPRRGGQGRRAAGRVRRRPGFGVEDPRRREEPLRRGARGPRGRQGAARGRGGRGPQPARVPGLRAGCGEGLPGEGLAGERGAEAGEGLADPRPAERPARRRLQAPRPGVRRRGRRRAALPRRGPGRRPGPRPPASARPSTTSSIPRRAGTRPGAPSAPRT
jgi:hypothetical protein